MTSRNKRDKWRESLRSNQLELRFFYERMGFAPETIERAINAVSVPEQERAQKKSSEKRTSRPLSTR
jgi:hypothetical protein